MSKLLKYRDEFEQLFKDNYARLYFYALNLIKDKEDARDMVSSVFEYVWDNYSSLESSTSPVPLLYTLLRNKCIDYMRHQETIEKHYKYLYQEGIFWTEDIYEEYDDRILKIKDIIEKLPEQTKKVVIKCFLEGKKYREASEEMDISINTVKTHITKALRLFRDAFGRTQL